MSKSSKIVLGIIVIVAAAAVAWFLTGNNSSQTAETPAATPLPASPLLAVTPQATPLDLTDLPPPPPVPVAPGSSVTPPNTGVKEFAVKATQYTFDPAEIRVKKGDQVKITLTSVDVAHGLAIPQFNVNLQAPVGSPQSAEFTADQSGTFSFFCSVFCGSGHRDMKGQLVVE